MNGFEVEAEQGNIGRMAVIVHNGRCYTANVIDQIQGTTTPKRVRIQFDAWLQGEVLMPADYEFKEWADCDD